MLVTLLLAVSHKREAPSNGIWLGCVSSWGARANQEFRLVCGPAEPVSMAIGRRRSTAGHHARPGFDHGFLWSGQTTRRRGSASAVSSLCGQPGGFRRGGSRSTRPHGAFLLAFSGNRRPAGGKHSDRSRGDGCQPHGAVGGRRIPWQSCGAPDCGSGTRCETTIDVDATTSDKAARRIGWLSAN